MTPNSYLLCRNIINRPIIRVNTQYLSYICKSLSILSKTLKSELKLLHLRFLLLKIVGLQVCYGYPVQIIQALRKCYIIYEGQPYRLISSIGNIPLMFFFSFFFTDHNV